jgi:hypothetical protein
MKWVLRKVRSVDAPVGSDRIPTHWSEHVEGCREALTVVAGAGPMGPALTTGCRSFQATWRRATGFPSRVLENPVYAGLDMIRSVLNPPVEKNRATRGKDQRLCPRAWCSWRGVDHRVAGMAEQVSWR